MHFAGAGKPLIKFKHCERSIYSFSVPQCCPLCQGDVGSTRIEDAPISISDPFSNGHQEKCSFLLKPTRGTFLRYVNVFPAVCQPLNRLGRPCAVLCSVWGVALGRLLSSYLHLKAHLSIRVGAVGPGCVACLPWEGPGVCVHIYVVRERLYTVVYEDAR